MSDTSTSGGSQLTGNLREFLFFLLTSYLVVLSASLISHLHTLLLLSPALPTCPPMNPFAHIVLLARVASDPPAIDVDALRGLVEAEETLRKGSKSFGVAKLAFGREMRIGLVAIYAWSRVTVRLSHLIPLHGVLTSRCRTISLTIPFLRLGLLRPILTIRRTQRSSIPSPRSERISLRRTNHTHHNQISTAYWTIYPA